MRSLRGFRPRLPNTERGATLVEYALIVALMVVTSLGAIKSLERNADSYYDTTSSRIGALPSTNGAAPTGTSIPGASSTTTAPTTTTTAAPTTTTAAPTTTTTAAPTTTTAAPTTTTTAAPRSFVSATSNSSDTSGSGWRPGITVTIRNTSTNAVIGNATITVTFTTTGGTNLGTGTCTTAVATGQCLARKAGVSDSTTTVVATVTGVTSTPTWNNVTASRTVTHP